MTPEKWESIDRLFNAALDVPRARRAAFLAQACGGDHELRREVEALLSYEDEAERFMERPIVADVAERVAGQAELRTTRQLQERQFGVYRIISRLGQGGMGEVYLARDTRLGREVAIKLLSPAFEQDPQYLSRFEREARLLAAINHPNIATIHALEQHEQTRYLVLEYVPGETLAERAAHGPLPPAEALAIFRQIAQALAAAHNKGIMHRDLKPANIKITPEGLVKVLDFGLAKVAHTTAADGKFDTPFDASLPTGGFESLANFLVFGTVPYMSPEQTRGQPLDARTDWWSFGCVLYEALAGERAFKGEEVLDVVAEIIGGEPDWRALPPPTSPPLHALLRRCLTKDPAQRLSDAREALQLLADEPPLAPPSRMIFRSQPRWVWLVLAVLAALGLLLELTVVWWWLR